jgi:hypothetical protein
VFGQQQGEACLYEWHQNSNSREVKRTNCKIETIEHGPTVEYIKYSTVSPCILFPTELRQSRLSWYHQQCLHSHIHFRLFKVSAERIGHFNRKYWDLTICQTIQGDHDRRIYTLYYIINPPRHNPNFLLKMFWV